MVSLVAAADPEGRVVGHVLFSPVQVDGRGFDPLFGARPLKRAPCYDRMKALGAVFGTVYGWERPNWFAPEGYALDEAALAKPDVLTNENHAPPEADGIGAASFDAVAGVRTGAL